MEDRQWGKGHFPNNRPIESLYAKTSRGMVVNMVGTAVVGAPVLGERYFSAFDGKRARCCVVLEWLTANFYGEGFILEDLVREKFVTRPGQ